MDNPHTNILIIQFVITITASLLLICIGIFSWLLWLEFKQQSAIPQEQLNCATPDPIPTPHSEVFDSVQIGKNLFVNNCAACHNKNRKDDLTGPALGGVTKRWSKYPKADLYHFIRDSQTMIKKKHPQALQVWKEFKPTIMNSFPNLTNEQIAMLLLYIENQRDYIVN